MIYPNGARMAVSVQDELARRDHYLREALAGSGRTMADLDDERGSESLWAVMGLGQRLVDSSPRVSSLGAGAADACGMQGATTALARHCAEVPTDGVDPNRITSIA